MRLRRWSPWLLRIELDKEMMVDKKLNMNRLGGIIEREFRDEMVCMFSDDNAQKLILRIHIISDAEGGKDENGDAMDQYDDAFLKKIESSMLSQVAIQVRWCTVM